MKSEIRKDYIQEKYVIIAPQRSERPHDVSISGSKSMGDTDDNCPFCPKRVRSNKIIFAVGNKKHASQLVLKNKYPAVDLHNQKAYGTQEVVVETPYHNRHLEELPLRDISALLHTYSKRTEALERISGIHYIIVFKNNGGEAGASLKHAHSQIFATGFVPPLLLDKSRKVFEYRLLHGTCVYCDTITKEAKGPRLVYKDDNVIAFAPYASRYNYEIWIMPLRHLDNIKKLTHSEHASMAKILQHALKKIKVLGLPYNYYFHQVVNDTDQHLYMKITPRGSIWAGVEVGSGLVINPVSPEDAAKYYRN